VLRGDRVAVFLDGCFWHGCPDHFRPPVTNAAYWCAKIAANRARDGSTGALLEAAGWAVVRVWEHETTAAAARRVFAALARVRSAPDQPARRAVRSGATRGQPRQPTAARRLR
jgi:DNA mismatch endonuclease (patch repair protein)